MKRYHRLLLALAALLLLLGGGWFLYRTGFFAAARSVQGLRDYISRSAPYAHLCFLLVRAGCSSGPGPHSCSPSGR